MNFILNQMVQLHHQNFADRYRLIIGLTALTIVESLFAQNRKRMLRLSHDLLRQFMQGLLRFDVTGLSPIGLDPQPQAGLYCRFIVA